MADEKSNPPKDEKETAAVPASAPANGGFKSWLPLLLTIVLMPALAFGMTQFVIVPQLQKGLGVKTPANAAGGGLFNFGNSKKAEANNKKEIVMMNKLLVNVAGTMGARYLLVSVSLAGTGPQFKEKVTEHDAQLRDAACGVLAAKTLADLEKAGTRNQIRTELLTGFNNILGDSSVQDIYFTEFAIQ